MKKKGMEELYNRYLNIINGGIKCCLDVLKPHSDIWVMTIFYSHWWVWHHLAVGYQSWKCCWLKITTSPHMTYSDYLTYNCTGLWSMVRVSCQIAMHKVRVFVWDYGSFQFYVCILKISYERNSARTAQRQQHCMNDEYSLSPHLL